MKMFYKKIQLFVAILAPLMLTAEPVLEEVVVSARKVDENLQDVPIGMTVFTTSEVEDAGIERPDSEQGKE